MDQWNDFSRKQDSKKLIQWLHCRAAEFLIGTKCFEIMNISFPTNLGNCGLFITLKKGKKVRGCYGAFSHSTDNIESLLIDYLSGALTRDPRYPPLDIHELPETEIIVTITTGPYAVNDLDSVNMARYGIVIACDNGESTIYVPAEIRGYQNIKKVTANKICNVSAFKAVTLH